MLLITTLGVAAQQWALPRVSVTSLRGEPRHSAEQVSQVVMGTPLKVISAQGEWWKVQTPEGYEGYVRNNTLTGLSDTEMQKWRKAPRAVVCADRTVYAYSRPSDQCDRVTDLVNGSILLLPAPLHELDSNPFEEYQSRWVYLFLPDGRGAFIERNLIKTIEDWSDQPWNPAEMGNYARNFLGAPYVWGGTSSKGMDCSGLTQISAYQQGVLLPRDASQQAKIGQIVDKTNYENFQPGDLLFFGNLKTGRVTHVAISLGECAYIHSSGMVRFSSLCKEEPDYENPGLITVRRLDSATIERLSLRNHPWYFPQN